MARSHITQSDAARQLNRSQAYVSDRLTGRASFDLDDLDKLGELLGFTGLQLLNEVVRRGELDKPKEHRGRLSVVPPESVDIEDYDTKAASEREDPAGHPEAE